MLPVLGVMLITTLAIVQAIAAICSRHWLHGYSDYGLLVATVSPWRVCALNSDANGNQTVSVYAMVCFGMRSWTGTGFGPLEIIQQLEYWSLGAQVVTVVVTIVLSCNQAYHKCYLRLKKPSLIFLALSCVLSVASIAVFPAASKAGLLGLTGQPTEGVLAWTYWMRLSACVTSFVALVAGSLLLKLRASPAELEDGDTVTFVDSDDGEVNSPDHQPMINASDL